MAVARDEQNYFTREASDYTNQIQPYVVKMLNLAEEQGFNASDTFYLIMTAVNEHQLLNLLK